MSELTKHARRGWITHTPEQASLAEANASVAVPQGGSWLRRLLAFSGPGYLISVGYMDPGNWATDIAGGAQFGYTLLSVIMISNLMAVLLQALSARLGIATGQDLAQACRHTYSPPVNFALWLGSESAIIATDLAEVIGTAIALELLFGIPLVFGVLLTGLDAALLLMLMDRGFRHLESFVIAMLVIIAASFAIQIALAAPPVAAVLAGFVPQAEIITNPAMLYVAIGIVGATVMPHNLYLHSSIVQTRAYPRTDEGRRSAIGFAVADSTIALTLALLVNAAILIVAAAVFHASGHTEVGEIGDAYRLLSPLLGVSIASAVFGVALLCSGINSTVTGTLAGQIVMEGFLRLRLRPVVRRLITRGLAIVPVFGVALVSGAHGTAQLLVLSQVVLSMQLPFAVIPLVRFVSDRRRMGQFVTPLWLTALAWLVTAVIVVLNVKLLLDAVLGA